MARIHRGHTYRTQKSQAVNTEPFKVPQLVNSSCRSFLGRYQPTNRQVKKPPNGRNIWPVTKSNTSNSLLPPTERKVQSPKDMEQKVPITQTAKEMNVAAFLREIFISSQRNAVLTSCNDIRDVNAAKESKA